MEEVRKVLSEPDRLEDSIKGGRNAFKTVKGRLLKVTYKDDKDRRVIITAMIK